MRAKNIKTQPGILHTIKLGYFLSIALTFYSCGQIGKIKSYEYNVPKITLEKYINDYYRNHPNIKKANENPRYNLNGTGYEYSYLNCYLQVGKDTFIYTFSFLGDSLYWNTHKNSEILLRNTCKYGETLKTNSQLGFL